MLSFGRFVSSSVKLKFHGTDTDTDILADFRARILAPKSACSVYDQPDTHDNPRRLVRRLDRHARGALFLARILARLSVGDAPVHTCKRVRYTINYRVYVYKITR